MAAIENKYEQLLARLCSLCGIAAEYDDIWGNRCHVSPHTQAAILAAMGIPIENDESALQAALHELVTRPWRQPLPGVKVVRENESRLHIPLRIPADRSDYTFTWTLTTEQGDAHSESFRPCELEVVAQREIDGTDHVHYDLSVAQACKPGYNRLTLEPAYDAPPALMQLIVAPTACYQPRAIQNDRRVWGPTLQLYSVASEHNWGIGDFGDLNRLGEWCAQSGAGILGVNPLHSLFPHNPAQASPYGPSSRLFLNILYIDVEAVTEFADCATREPFVSIM